MKKINRIGIKDVLIKRYNQMNNKAPLKHHSLDEQGIVNVAKHFDLNPIIQKINKMPNNEPMICQLTHDQKITIIQAISHRVNISLNLQTSEELMTVWKVPKQQKLLLNNFSKKNIPNRQSKMRNYFVIRGNLEVYQRQRGNCTQPQLLTSSQASNLMKSQKKQKYNRNLNEQNRKESKKMPEQDNLRFTTELGADSNSPLLKNKHTTLQNQAESCQDSELLQSLKFQQPLTILEQMVGWGPIFGRKDESKDFILLAKCGIFLEIKNPEFQNMLINPGGMDQAKKFQIIEKFPVFKKIARKIQHFLPHIQLKHFSRNQYIYRAAQKPTAVYLIIKGEIIFEIKLDAPKKKYSPFMTSQPIRHQQQSEAPVQTETLGVGSYFGDEQILFKTQRKLNALCHSSQCDVLQIPLQKFEKLLMYSDFQSQIQYNASIKIRQREQKITKAIQIHCKFWTKKQQNSENQEVNLQTNKNKSECNSVLGKRRKRSTQPVKVMHGNVIKKIPNLNQSEEVNFSMLAANPDMYAATLKKFRKYTMKQPEKVRPQVNWNLKRVWKVLNLQSILREDAEVTGTEGKTFYESHRRLQNHVSQVKSIRPKTSSSTYRTKLQYIAYLQQFND